MNKTNEAPTELSLDSLDNVVGGKGTAIINGTFGLGPVSVGVTVDLQNGHTYMSAGVSPSLSFGGSVSLGAVIPYNRDTPASDVITGWGVGADAYLGGGGGVSANSSGMIISAGFGLSVSVGATETGSLAPDTHSPTSSMPAYDALGNATGQSYEVPNPSYIPPADMHGRAYADESNHSTDDADHDGSNAIHEAENASHDGGNVNHDAGDASHNSHDDGSIQAADNSSLDGGGHAGSLGGDGYSGNSDGSSYSDSFDSSDHSSTSDGGGYSGGFDGGGYSGGFDGGGYSGGFSGGGGFE